MFLPFIPVLSSAQKCHPGYIAAMRKRSEPVIPAPRRSVRRKESDERSPPVRILNEDPSSTERYSGKNPSFRYLKTASASKSRPI